MNIAAALALSSAAAYAAMPPLVRLAAGAPMRYVAVLAMPVVSGALFSGPSYLNVDHRIKETLTGWVAVNAEGRSAPLVNVTIFDGDPSAGRSIAPLVHQAKNGFYVDYVIGASANGTGIRCEYFGTAATLTRVVHGPLACKFVSTSRPVKGARFDCR